MRRGLWILGILVALLAALAGGLTWFVQREATLAWLIERGAHDAGMKVIVQGLSGTLLTPIGIDRIVLENDDLRIEARRVRFAWASWRSLAFARTLDITEFAIESAELVQKRTSAARGVPPTSLALPVTVRADRLEIARLAISIPSASATLERLRAGYGYDRAAGTHALVLTRVDTGYHVIASAG